MNKICSQFDVPKSKEANKILHVHATISAATYHFWLHLKEHEDYILL